MHKIFLRGMKIIIHFSYPLKSRLKEKFHSKVLIIYKAMAYD